MLNSENLSKAYNRGSHMIVIDDLYSMHTPKWLLAVLFSYLTSRSMLLKYQNTISSSRSLPGGFGQGVWLGGILFIIKFYRACQRPPIPSHTGQLEELSLLPRAAGPAPDSTLPAVRGADCYKVQTQGHLPAGGEREDR